MKEWFMQHISQPSIDVILIKLIVAIQPDHQKCSAKLEDLLGSESIKSRLGDLVVPDQYERQQKKYYPCHNNRKIYKPKETEKSGQKQTEKERNGQKQTEKDRNRHFSSDDISVFVTYVFQ